jgi:hypothetical protein
MIVMWTQARVAQHATGVARAVESRVVIIVTVDHFSPSTILYGRRFSPRNQCHHSGPCSVNHSSVSTGTPMIMSGHRKKITITLTVFVRTLIAVALHIQYTSLLYPNACRRSTRIATWEAMEGEAARAHR